MSNWRHWARSPETIPTTLPLQHGAAHLLGRHDPGGLSGVVVGDTTAQLRVMMSFTWVLRVLLRRHAAQDDVPVGDNAPQAAVLTADGQGAHVVPGQEPGRQGGRLAGVMETTLGFIRSRTCMTKPPFSQTLLLVWTGRRFYSFSPRLRRRAGAPPGEGPAPVLIPEHAFGEPLEIGVFQSVYQRCGKLRQRGQRRGGVVGAGLLAEVAAPDEGWARSRAASSSVSAPSSGSARTGSGTRPAPPPWPRRGPPGRPAVRAVRRGGALRHVQRRPVRMVPRNT